MIAAAPPPVSTVVRYEPRGGARRALESRAPEVLLEGPVGTGKSMAWIWKSHLVALKYPGSRTLWVRKTMVSLTNSIVASYKKHVLSIAHWGVRYFGGSGDEPRAYQYPNGSRIVLGGMDKPDKVMSTEYDVIVYFEATEGRLVDWESLITRLRNNVMPYQQIVADCNPAAPNHWLNVRANEQWFERIHSRHKDNPLLWDILADQWTEFGERYMSGINRATGVRHLRLVEGKWAAAEGQVFDAFDPAVHLVDQFDIPVTWPRIWSIDFGYNHPFVWQWWAIGLDGQLILYREMYMTGQIVADHARRGMDLCANDPPPVAIITDHDAEDRATFERETGLTTTAATKRVSPGIQAVKQRLQVSGNGRPRLVIFNDALDSADQELRNRAAPTSTAEEFASYVWDIREGRAVGESPVKEHDHGMDALRYLVSYVDGMGGTSNGMDDVMMVFQQNMGTY